MKQDACRDCFSGYIMYGNMTAGFFNLSAGAKTVWQKKSASVSWRKVGA